MSKIEVNTVAPQCGTTLTLGESGDTVTLGSGASQSGFGRTGTVDWQTTKKTADFTAANGEGYFIDTSGGAVTMTLPASPSAGDIVAFKDYSGDFSTNNLTIGRNSSNLDGASSDKAIDTNNTSMSLVYVDATQGWKSVEEGTGFIGENFIVATGGTITTSGNCKIHTFTGPGTFTVSCIATNSTNNVVSYMVVAGGGGAGECRSGGGGGGGFREYKSPVTPYTASPLDGNPGGTSVTVSAQAYPITVGGGGAGSTDRSVNGTNGVNSVFSTITSAGGGGSAGDGSQNGSNGGSGGGGANSGTKGSGNTPPVSPPQGKDGGCSTSGYVGSGGGGATVAGTTAGPISNPGGPGGAGATTSISGSPTAYAGGGGGGGSAPVPLAAGTGGTGGGGDGTTPGCSTGGAGTANTGGGGGGNGGAPGCGAGGAGGSGIVVIRYKYQ